MKHYKFILPFLFFSTLAYADTPTEHNTAVNIGINKIFDATGKIKSANLASTITDETGTNTVVFSSGSTLINSTLTNPIITGKSVFPSGVWDSNGNVRIGTTTPSANPLEIVQTAQNVLVGLISTDPNGYPSFGLYRNSNVEIGRFQAGLNNTFATNGDNVFIWNPVSGGQTIIRNGTVNRLTITPNNILIGAAAEGTGTGWLAIANGNITGVAAIANQAQFAVESGAMKVMNGSGVITTLSNHTGLDMIDTNINDPLPSTQDSECSYLGKRKIINWSAFIEAVETLTGKSFTTYIDIPQRNWTADQLKFKDQKHAEILKVNAEIEKINVDIGAIDNESVIGIVSDQRRKELDVKKTDLLKLKATLNNTIPDEYIPCEPPKWMQDRGVKLSL